MELWYTEQYSNDVRFSVRTERHIHSVQSDFQKIDVFDSKEFGRFFTLDGLMMVTEKDEFIYHDMLVHVPMATNPYIKDVLVIGVGDGGTVRELTRYNTIERIDVVEIDKAVYEICCDYLPHTANRLNDPRVNIYFESGLKFVRNKIKEYDLIIVDATDPFGHGESLFTKEFYGNCYKALTDDGILINQHDCPNYATYAKTMKKAYKRIAEFFPIHKVYQAHIPTYPSGQWLFGFASKKYDPIKDIEAVRWNELGLDTKYYNTDLHVGSFALPNYVKQMLEDNNE